MGVLPPTAAYANVNPIYLALIDLAPLALKNRGALRERGVVGESKKRAVKNQRSPQ